MVSQASFLAATLITVLVAIAAGLIGATPLSTPAYAALNTVLPLSIFAGFGGLAVWLAATAPTLIWTPLVMFLANMAVFRGIGPLVYVFGSEVTQARIWHGAWGLTPAELFSTHLLNLTGAAAVLAGMCLVILRREGAERPRSAPAMADRIPAAAISLFVVGAAVRYGLYLPVTFGDADLPLPGVVRNLRILVDLAFALFAFLAVRRGGRWTLLFWLLFPPHLLTLVLEFKKSAVALGLMFPVLGVFLATGKVRGLIVGATLIGLLIVALHPVVKQARAEMTYLSGTAFGASFSQRIDILKSPVVNGPGASASSAAGEDAQVGWVRLSYAAQQAIAMRSYDARQPRDTVSTAWQVFIPRLLWPEKPDFSNLSDAFYRAVTGTSGALVGATVFADAYWNFGWPGVVTIGLLVGLLFGGATRFSARVVRARDFVLLPAVFLTMDMALRGMNGWILSGLIGPVPVFVAYLGLVQLLRRPRRREWLA